MKDRKVVISVIGSHDNSDKVVDLAQKVGRIVAEVGAVLVCGGLGGAMEASSKGAKEAGGLTIGILPGKNKDDANPYIDISLPTSIGYARNAIVACSADMIIALPGSYGTTSEICYGLVFDRPVFDLGHWNIEGMTKVKNLDDLKQKLQEYMSQIN